MFGLPPLEYVAGIADQERRDDIAIRRILREAVVYIPPFTQRVAEQLTPMEDLIRQHRSKTTEAPSRVKQVDQKVEAAADRTLYTPPQSDDQAVRARQLTRELVKFVHTDRSGPVTSVVPNEDISYTLQRALVAKGTGDSSLAQSLLLQTTPRVLVNKLKLLITEGYSFDQIAAANPDMAAEMAILNELGYVQYGAGGSLQRPQARRTKAIKTPEDAEREATSMKLKDDRKARIFGLGMIYEVFEEIQPLATTAADTARLALIKAAMEKAGGVVGGIDEFFAQNGTRYQINYLQSKLEDFIAALPERILAVAQGLVDGSDIEAAADSLLASVIEVERSGRRYIYGMEEAANPPVKSDKTEQIITNFTHEKKYNKENYTNKKNY